MKSIEFDYDTQDGRTITIFGEVDNGNISFTAEENGTSVKKKTINNRDQQLICGLIEDNVSDYEDDMFEDAYDCE